MPRIHLVNPSAQSFGVAVITPRWLYVLAAATGTAWGDPASSTKRSSPSTSTPSKPGDVVGIGIHTGNALRGYEIGRHGARARRVGRVRRHSRHAVSRTKRASTARAHAVVKGDGDLVWPTVVADCFAGQPQRALRRRPHRRRAVRVRRGGTCCRQGRYMWASVQTVRGCPKHCSFCSVWRTDGQEPRQRGVDRVVQRDRRAAAPRASASSRWPTTTSIR